MPAITALPPGCAFEPRCSWRIASCSIDAAAAGRSCARPSGPLSGCFGGGPLTDARSPAQRHSCQPRSDGGVPRRRSAARLVVNLGDVVGYNASPNEVCERVRAMGGPMVRGNHDRACTGLTRPVGVQSGGGHVGAMDAESRWRPNIWIGCAVCHRGRSGSTKLPGIEFVHGSPRDEDEYLLNASTAHANFRMPGHADIMIFGHTHLQGGFVYQDGRTHPLTPGYGSMEGAVESHSDAHARASATSSIPARSGSPAMVTGGRPSLCTRGTGMRPRG